MSSPSPAFLHTVSVFMVPFHIVDQDTYPVIRFGEREVPIEGDIRSQMVNVEVIVDDWRSNNRK